MAALIALWTEPADVDAFTADYQATHVGLCQALPGIESVTTSPALPGGPYHRVTILRFASQEAMFGALGGGEGAAVMADSERLTSTFGNKVEAVLAPEL
jgi:uncharacterized protein (TIGR02118 family)